MMNTPVGTAENMVIKLGVLRLDKNSNCKVLVDIEAKVSVISVTFVK